MKAAQTFKLIVDKKGNRISRGGEEITIKKGETIPDKYVSDLIQSNRDYLDGLVYKDMVLQLTPKERKKYDMGTVSSTKPVEAEKTVKKGKKNA